MSKTWVTAALALALSPLAASAQEYAVKIKLPGLGDKSLVKSTSNWEAEFKVLDDGGNAIVDAKELKVKKFVFSEVGLERAQAGDELVRVKRKYEHAERKIKDTRETLPFQGKTVLIEKKDGRFQFQIENDEVIEGKDAEELNEEFNKGGLRKFVTDHFLPRKLVKVNEKWTFDVAPLARAFSGDGKIEIDDAKSTGSGKLLKAYQKNGKQFGVIQVTIEFPVTQFVGGDDNAKHATKNSKLTIQLEADCCIDGTLDVAVFKGAIRGNVRAEGITIDGVSRTLAITLNATSEDLWTPVTK
jgi:hypothetical protein